MDWADHKVLVDGNMETKTCINPACGNTLRVQDVFCGQCGKEQPERIPQKEASDSETAMTGGDAKTPIHSTQSPFAQNAPVEVISVSDKPAVISPPSPVITPYLPSPALIGRSCPICLTDLHPLNSYTREMVVECPACHSIHHQKCWESNQGCSTYGCKWMPSTEVQSNRTILSSPAGYPLENSYQNTRVVSRSTRKGRGMAFLANLELVCGLVPFLAPLGLLLGFTLLVFSRRGLSELSSSHRMRFWVGFIAGCVILLLSIFAGTIYLVFEFLGPG